MKKILVPIDINKVSINALDYAMQCFPKSEIHAVHVKTFLGDIDNYQTDHQVVSNEQYWKNDLADYIIKGLKLSELPSNIKIDVKYGGITSELVTFANSEGIDHIVMGTRDKYTLFDKWIGTVSLSLIKSAKQSITLVPVHSQYKAYEKVLVASDQNLKNESLSKRIMDWNESYKAHLKFIHITNDDRAFSEEKNTIVDSFFEKGNPDFNFEISLMKGVDVTESLLAAAYNFGAELLIAMPADETYLHTLLFKSISKELLEKSHIPVLFLKNRIN